MTKKIKKNFFVLFFLICGLNLPAQTAFPRIDPSDESYHYASKKTPYSWQDLSEIGLWASGVQHQKAYLERIREAVDILQSKRNLNTRARGEFALAFMHDRYLTEYDENQTRLDTLLENGAYNCVSSAVFYTILAVSLGLDVRAVMTHDHAFVMLNADGAMIDVETTNKYGFDPGSKIEFKDNFGRITGYAYVDPKNYSDRSTISQLELVSLILSNRITLLEKSNRFQDAAPLITDRGGLLSMRAEKTNSPFFTDPRNDLLNNLRNIGVQLENSGRDKDALDFMARVCARYPDEYQFQQLSYAVINNAVVRLLQKNHVNEARNTLETYAFLLNQENFHILSAQILELELVQSALEIKTPDDAEVLLKRLDDPETASYLGEDRVAEIRNATVNAEALLLIREKGLREAIRFAETSLKRYGKNATLEKNLESFRANLITELHNTFVTLWNSGKKGEARAFLLAALQEFPENRQLLKDWELVSYKN